MRTTSSSQAKQPSFSRTKSHRLSSDFLAERGLTLSPKKTIVTHVDHGFDFLGWNVRKYDGKMLITPSKKSVQTFWENRALVNKKHLPQTALIGVLNPLIRGWQTIIGAQVAGKTFLEAEWQNLERLYGVAKARHPNKSGRWIAKNRYSTAIPDEHSRRVTEREL